MLRSRKLGNRIFSFQEGHYLLFSRLQPIFL